MDKYITKSRAADNGMVCYHNDSISSFYSFSEGLSLHKVVFLTHQSCFVTRCIKVILFGVFFSEFHWF